MEVKIARRYQVTIPQEVREKMDLSVGDVAEIRYEDGRIIIEKVLKGIKIQWWRRREFGGVIQSSGR